ncbi:glutathione synthase [Halorhodospira halophila]|uniref:glutathione synthase n=1 Tax=Halorhodospira halophila TaxID=1053 RepID=UPI0019133E5F|nr:glutathione synthase [Halorhodospira halophila]MBK5935910.1 glutathione synthase [Halorhodospira halophila]
MSARLGAVMDPIAAIHPRKDSTLALMLEAQRRGYELWYFLATDLYADGGAACGRGRPAKVRDDERDWYTLGEPRPMPLAELDTILMREDPPVDAGYISATQLLSLAEAQGVRVVNRPAALRDANEKLFALHWPHLCPATRVAADPTQLRAFIAEQGKAVLKPLDAMGGASIFVLEAGDPNTSVVLETLTDGGRRYALAQEYLPRIEEGDKRVLVFGGEPFPHALARIPARGETRGNLAAGGRGEAAPVTERERAVCAELAPTLRERGLELVGLDFIGERLTEINVTSPTCFREIDALCGVNTAGAFFDHLEGSA